MNRGLFSLEDSQLQRGISCGNSQAAKSKDSVDRRLKTAAGSRDSVNRRLKTAAISVFCLLNGRKQKLAGVIAETSSSGLVSAVVRLMLVGGQHCYSILLSWVCCGGLANWEDDWWRL
ncbi:uncharacterized protein LOC116252620 [Nymphaea colorata]|uniref:uncharacterized protein LOC116252620 n=1 Tax=Nymphaea colorata TaxID=210225 RepID=UPI00129EE3C3|nr:uncharacterized protein LOC116252620 [Nymphaea colorata]